MMKKFILMLVVMVMVVCPMVTMAATGNIGNSIPIVTTGITATNYYGTIAPSISCPALPWTNPAKTVILGASTSGLVSLPNAVTGQTLCFYATFSAGVLESAPSNVVSGLVPPPTITDLTVKGILTIQ